MAARCLILTGLVPAVVFQAPIQGHAQGHVSVTLEDILQRANAAQRADRFSEAATAYAEATAIDPHIPELWANRGLMEHLAGHAALAIESFKHALAAKPTLYTAVLFTGIDYVKLNEPERALTYLKRALALKPANADSYEAIGNAYMMLHQPESAAFNYQRAIVHNSQSGAAWYGLGVASLALIDQNGATLAKRHAKAPWSLALYADELLLQNRPLEALDAYRRVAATSTEDDRQVFALVLLHTKTMSAASGDPTYPPIPMEAMLHILGTDPASLTPICPAIRSQNPDTRRSSSGSLKMVCTYLQNDAVPTADAAAKQLASHPEDPETLYWSIKANEARAVEALDHFERLAPQSATTYDLIGDLDRRRMLPDSSLQQYERALAIDPQDMPALLGSAAAYLSIGKMEKSMAMAKVALADLPDDPRLNLLMSESLISLHRYPDAGPYLEKCLAVISHSPADPGSAGLAPRAHALLGRVQAEAGNIENATSEMKLGLTSDRDGSLHFQLSRLYRQQGKFNEARLAESQAKDLLEQRRAYAAIAVRSSAESLP